MIPKHQHSICSEWLSYLAVVEKVYERRPTNGIKLVVDVALVWTHCRKSAGVTDVTVPGVGPVEVSWTGASGSRSLVLRKPFNPAPLRSPLDLQTLDPMRGCGVCYQGQRTHQYSRELTKSRE